MFLIHNNFQDILLDVFFWFANIEMSIHGVCEVVNIRCSTSLKMAILALNFMKYVEETCRDLNN